jgi:hypothetical protein
MRATPLLFAVAVLLAGCGGNGGDAGPATTATAASPPPATTAATATDTGDVATADLPPACVEAITQAVRTLEPLVRDIDFSSATADAQVAAIAEQTGELEAFDPDVCPDVEVDEARAAWVEIAKREAPGTIPYIEFIYGES